MPRSKLLAVSFIATTMLLNLITVWADEPQLLKCYNCSIIGPSQANENCRVAPELLSASDAVVPCAGACVVTRFFMRLDSRNLISMKRFCSNESIVDSKVASSPTTMAVTSTCHFSLCNVGDGSDHYPANYTSAATVPPFPALAFVGSVLLNITFLKIC